MPSVKVQNALRKIAAGPNSAEQWIEGNVAHPIIDWLAAKFGANANDWRAKYANNRTAWNLGGLGLGALGLTALGHLIFDDDDDDDRRGRRRSFGSQLGSWLLPIGALVGGGYLLNKYGLPIFDNYSRAAEAQRETAERLARWSSYPGKAVRWVGRKIRGASTAAAETAKGVGEYMSAAGGRLKDIAADAGRSVAETAQGAGEYAADAGNAVKGAAKRLKSEVRQFGKDLDQAVRDNYTTMGDMLYGAAKRGSETVSKAGTKIRQNAITNVDAIKQRVDNIKQRASAAAKSVAQKFNEGYTQGRGK